MYLFFYKSLENGFGVKIEVFGNEESIFNKDFTFLQDYSGYLAFRDSILSMIFTLENLRNKNPVLEKVVIYGVNNRFRAKKSKNKFRQRMG